MQHLDYVKNGGESAVIIPKREQERTRERKVPQKATYNSWQIVYLSKLREENPFRPVFWRMFYVLQNFGWNQNLWWNLKLKLK